MKTILIATDFSGASGNASLYGAQLAKEINANVILFNAYDIPTPAAGLNIGVSRYGVKTQIEQKLKDEINRIHYNDMPSVEPICDEGNAEDAIINIAHEKHADFIVVGMKGSGKNLRKVFGSTVTSLIKKPGIPVIIVPEHAKYKSPRNIVLASESTIGSDKNVPEHLRQITQLFKSKLNVVRVVKNEEEQLIERLRAPEDPDKVAHTSDTSFEYPIDADVRHALNDFIKNHDCDMLAMMPHKHEWIERLFKKSETKEMIFHTHIPLLVLPETFSSISEKN